MSRSTAYSANTEMLLASGGRRAKLLIVGQNPGKDECNGSSPHPLVGDTGKRLFEDLFGYRCEANEDMRSLWRDQRVALINAFTKNGKCRMKNRNQKFMLHINHAIENGIPVLLLGQESKRLLDGEVNGRLYFSGHPSSKNTTYEPKKVRSWWGVFGSHEVAVVEDWNS